MSASRLDETFLLRMEKPLIKEYVAENAASIAAALENLAPGSALSLESSHLEGLDASGLAFLLTLGRECRARSVELRLRLPATLADFAEDLRLSKHLVVENPEGPK